jgi:bacterioferritin-associated ferredoxin
LIAGLVFYVVLAAFWFTPAPIAIAEEGKATDEASFEFIGAKKCGMCHKSEKKGAQLAKWQESKHSKAYETLASDAAKAIAAEKELATPAQEAPECLKCHVTAFSVMANIADQKITLEEGVSCESCHGPGSAYSKMKVMKAITAGTQDAGEVGLTTPTAETCTGCHNEESPTFKGEFKFEEMAAKIAHPYPEESESE